MHLDDHIDLESIALSSCPNESLIRLGELVFGVVLKSENSDQYIERILGLDQDVQYDLQVIIERSLGMGSATPVQFEETHYQVKEVKSSETMEIELQVRRKEEKIEELY